MEIRAWHNENTEPGHSKFYRAYAANDARFALYNWGRRGTAGQSKRLNVELPQWVALDQIDAKRRRGYEPVENVRFSAPESIAKLDLAELNAALDELFVEELRRGRRGLVRELRVPPASFGDAGQIMAVSNFSKAGDYWPWNDEVVAALSACPHVLDTNSDIAFVVGPTTRVSLAPLWPSSVYGAGPTVATDTEAVAITALGLWQPDGGGIDTLGEALEAARLLA